MMMKKTLKNHDELMISSCQGFLDRHISDLMLEFYFDGFRN